MRERAELALKIACLALAALMLYELSRFMTRTSPLAHLSIPELPTLSEGSNAPIARAVTNSSAPLESEKKGTNSVAAKEEAAKPETNAISSGDAGKKATNAVTGPAPGKTETNALAAKKEPGKKETNSVPAPVAARMGMPSLPNQGPGNGPPPLPPLIQARIERITQSEILGQIIRPMPMGLLGIAGKTAFMRAPNGQTGLMKEGEDLGGIKLLRIGTNRVLVEEAGEKKELIIFSGLGGDTLMPQPKQTPNETITKTQ